MRFLNYLNFLFGRTPIVFLETMYDQPGIRYFINALGEELAGSDLFIVKLQSLKQEVDPVSTELKGRVHLFRYSPIGFGLFLGLPKILEFAFVHLLPGKKRLFTMSYRGVDVSNEFDDVMDINLGLGWQDRPSWVVMRRAMIEISYAVFIAAVFSFFKGRIKWAIAADSAYRYGFITKAAKSNGVPVITNIDLNGLFMNCYSHKTLLDAMGRKITEEDCANVQQNVSAWQADITEYFRKRFAGEILQHDVLNAYTRREKIPELGPFTLKKDASGRILVTLFAHVFRDAPRNTTGRLFADFYQWFIQSVAVLAANPNIMFCVREHPSAHLYGEKSLVGKILAQMGLSDQVVLWGSETTGEVLARSDVVVTCSGTVGLEAVYLGKSVVIASQCSYSELGLCHEFKTPEGYLTFLAALTRKVGLPQTYRADKAALVSFVHFKVFNNRHRYEDFPLPPFLRGVAFGKSGNELFEKLREYVSGDTLFHSDLRQFLVGTDARFLPQQFPPDTQIEVDTVSHDTRRVFLTEYSVVIVGFRSQRVISTCLDALIRGARATSRPIQVIVVDNDPDQKWETLREIDRQNYPKNASIEIRQIESPRNGGFSFGCNLGAKEASGRWLLFLNPDAFIAEDFFRELEYDLSFVSSTMNDDRPIVMGMKMVDGAGRKTRNGGILPERFAFERGTVRDIFDSGYMLKVDHHDVEGLVWPLGAGFLVSNDVFKNVGGFDEGLFLTLEEPSFLRRLRRYVLYFSKATLVHEGGHSYSNKLAEYNVFYRSLKHYFSNAKFNRMGSAKILLTLLRIKARILALTVKAGFKSGK